MINKTVYLLLLPLWFLIVVLYECFLMIMSNIKMLPKAIRLIIKGNDMYPHPSTDGWPFPTWKPYPYVPPQKPLEPAPF